MLEGTVFIIVCSILTNIFVFLLEVKRKHYFSPASVFSLLWTIIFLLYLLKIGEWRIISPFSAFCFFVGNCILLLFYGLSNHLYKCKKETCHELNYPLINCLLVVSIAVLLMSGYKNILALFSGKSFNEIYISSIINEEINSGSSIEKILTILVCKPILFVSIPLLSNELFKKHKNYLLIILSLFYFLVNILSNGRRSFLIYVLFAVVISFFIQRKKNKKKTHFFKILIILIPIILIVLAVGNNRGSNLVDSFSTYFAGCVPSFDIRIGSLNENYYGLGFLHGIVSPFMIALKGLFHSDYPSYWVTFDAIIESADEVWVGPNTSLNAFNSLYFVSYVDGGLLGIFIEMAIVGCFLGITYKRFSKNDASFNQFFYIFAIILVIGSMYTLYFTQYPFVIGLLYSLLIFKKTKKQRGALIFSSN